MAERVVAAVDRILAEESKSKAVTKEGPEREGIERAEEEGNEEEEPEGGEHREKPREAEEADARNAFEVDCAIRKEGKSEEDGKSDHQY